MSDQAVSVNAQTTEDFENSEDVRGGSRRWIRLLLVVIGGILTVSLLITIAHVLPTAVMGQAEESTSASVVTGLATLLLVIITWMYVGETQSLVDLTREQSRIQERNRKNRIRHFRVALVEEIGADQNWDRFRRLLSNHGSIPSPVPTQVYETTPWRVGQLSEDERVAVIKYYTSVLNLQRMLDKTPHAELTTTDGELVQRVEKQITMIDEFQDQAIKAIEQNLEDTE